eukprot:3484864-Rhodomonas_salina.4
MRSGPARVSSADRSAGRHATEMAPGTWTGPTHPRACVPVSSWHPPYPVSVLGKLCGSATHSKARTRASRRGTLPDLELAGDEEEAVEERERLVPPRSVSAAHGLASTHTAGHLDGEREGVHGAWRQEMPCQLLTGIAYRMRSAPMGEGLPSMGSAKGCSISDNTWKDIPKSNATNHLPTTHRVETGGSIRGGVPEGVGGVGGQCHREGKGDEEAHRHLRGAAVPHEDKAGRRSIRAVSSGGEGAG